MKKLHVLWTSGERDVALKVVFPYLLGAKANGWWDEINLIVWGPSALLLAGDEQLQSFLRDVADSGVSVEACKNCTDSYKVTDKLQALQISIRYLGAPFTDYLQGTDKVITF